MCYEKVTCNMLQMQHIIFVIKSVEQHFGNSLFSYLFKKMNNAIYPIEEDPVLNDKLNKKNSLICIHLINITISCLIIYYIT